MRQFNRAISILLTVVMMIGSFGVFTFNVQAAAIKIITQPESVTVGDGESGSFKVVAENAASYQWEYYSNGWQQSSVAAEEYGFTGLMKYDGMRYRCIVTGTDGSTVTTDEVTLKVIPVTITKQPLAQTLHIGDTAFWEKRGRIRGRDQEGVPPLPDAAADEQRTGFHQDP